MIVFAMDYMGTLGMSSNVKDAKAMVSLARTHCGVASILEYHEQMCTPARLEQAFNQISSKMRCDDYLVFCFYGQVIESNEQTSIGGETPLAFSLYERDGSIVEYSAWRFAEVLSTAMNEKARLLMLFDCCSPSSVIDLSDSAWDDIQAMAISGYDDKEQPPAEDGFGIFTSNVLLAVQRLQQEGQQHYSVGAVFNEMLKENRKGFGRGEHFWLEHSAAVLPSSMAWPLLPTTKFDSTSVRGGSSKSSSKASSKSSTTTASSKGGKSTR
jgi:hypothetical protein